MSTKPHSLSILISALNYAHASASCSHSHAIFCVTTLHCISILVFCSSYLSLRYLLRHGYIHIDSTTFALWYYLVQDNLSSLSDLFRPVSLFSLTIESIRPRHRMFMMDELIAWLLRLLNFASFSNLFSQQWSLAGARSSHFINFFHLQITLWRVLVVLDSVSMLVCNFSSKYTTIMIFPVAIIIFWCIFLLNWLCMHGRMLCAAGALNHSNSLSILPL